jgi:hypothetical protein
MKVLNNFIALVIVNFAHPLQWNALKQVTVTCFQFVALSTLHVRSFCHIIMCYITSVDETSAINNGTINQHVTKKPAYCRLV